MGNAKLLLCNNFRRLDRIIKIVAVYDDILDMAILVKE
jgi:hypothetical protein